MPNQEAVFRKMFGGIPYTFHRKDGFYSLVLSNDIEAKANAMCNPGTIKVVNECTLGVVFREC